MDKYYAVYHPSEGEYKYGGMVMDANIVNGNVTLCGQVLEGYIYIRLDEAKPLDALETLPGYISRKVESIISTPETAGEIINRWVAGEDVPRDMWMCKEGNVWVAIDNTTNDCWVEEFPTFEQALEWQEGDGIGI